MLRCTPLRAAHDSGPRRASHIRHVVLHSTEGGTAESVARYFHTTAQASTQLVVDDDGCYRCVPDLVIPWGAPGVNRSGLHIEHCGYAHWSRAQWLRHEPMLRISADHAARWAWQYRLPIRIIGTVQLRLGFKGFLTHLTASRTFHTPGGHTDPGPGFPLDEYLRWTRLAYQRLVEERAASRPH